MDNIFKRVGLSGDIKSRFLVSLCLLPCAGFYKSVWIKQSSLYCQACLLICNGWDSVVGKKLPHFTSWSQVVSIVLFYSIDYMDCKVLNSCRYVVSNIVTSEKACVFCSKGKEGSWMCLFNFRSSGCSPCPVSYGSWSIHTYLFPRFDEFPQPCQFRMWLSRNLGYKAFGTDILCSFFSGCVANAVTYRTICTRRFYTSWRICSIAASHDTLLLHISSVH